MVRLVLRLEFKGLGRPRWPQRFSVIRTVCTGLYYHLWHPRIIVSLTTLLGRRSPCGEFIGTTFTIDGSHRSGTKRCQACICMRNSRQKPDSRPREGESTAICNSVLPRSLQGQGGIVHRGPARHRAEQGKHEVDSWQGVARLERLPLPMRIPPVVHESVRLL